MRALFLFIRSWHFLQTLRCITPCRSSKQRAEDGASLPVIYTHICRHPRVPLQCPFNDNSRFLEPSPSRTTTTTSALTFPYHKDSSISPCFAILHGQVDILFGVPLALNPISLLPAVPAALPFVMPARPSTDKYWERLDAGLSPLRNAVFIIYLMLSANQNAR